MKILVTGGTGYIGSHTVIELINDDNEVVIVDNLVNSNHEALRRVEKIVGKKIPFYELDLTDSSKLSNVFTEHPDIDAVVHFAGLKAVGQSVSEPLLYYRNNIDSTLTLCETMQAHNVKNLIFSSSATVYGIPEELPLREDSRVGFGITNPYGWTKYMIEQILRDLAVADPEWQVTLLRYFNPIGAHESGTIGEDPNGPPNNLLPFISQVAVGRREKLRVFGDDYETPDGTGVRDYIHVTDVARGHVAALNHPPQKGVTNTYNLGSGEGTSVFELMHVFEHACGKPIPYEIVDRRPGDIASCYASCEKANKELNWFTTKSLFDGCVDTWRWQSQNPNGYHS
jgi:UDP-glucose 4-epimerase